jgi:hypothetical protein
MIPKVIVQYWDQKKIPADEKSLMTSWINLNHGFEYALFDQGSARSFIFEHYGQDGLNVFDVASVPAMRSDVFRVAYILRFGGVYIDAATCSISNISGLFNGEESLHLMRKRHGGLWNGFIAAPPSHPMVQEIWNQILKNVQNRMSNNVFLVTGPGVFNDLVDSDNRNKERLSITEQSDATKFFKLVNELGHKKNNHWSNVQKNKSIFRENEERENEERESLGFDEARGSGIQKVILHLGPHQPGTTSFQTILEKNEELLGSAGYSLLTVRSRMTDSYKAWRNDYTRILQGFLLGKKKEAEVFDELTVKFSELVEFCSDDPAIGLIISDQNLLGPAPGQRYAGRLGRETSFYSAHALVFSAVKKAFSDRNLQVLLCKREFSDSIASSYGDFVFKLTSRETPKDFVGILDRNIRVGFERFYDRFVSEFGGAGPCRSLT